jgi:hypothetical protein
MWTIFEILRIIVDICGIIWILYFMKGFIETFIKIYCERKNIK